MLVAREDFSYCRPAASRNCCCASATSFRLRKRASYHNESADAEKRQIAPIFERSWYENPYFGQCNHHRDTHNGAPDREIVHRDERMCAFTNPSDRGICACSSKDSKKSNTNS